MEESRHSRFADKLSTSIWLEQADVDNPYLAARHLCHGYEIGELTRHCDATDMLYLLIKGDLPSPERKDLLRRLSVCCVSPGPRHPAVRAVMNAAGSGTRLPQLLPIGLALLGGDQYGSDAVFRAARFIGRSLHRDPESVVQEFLAAQPMRPSADQQLEIAPGFGSQFGSLDPWARQQAALLQESAGAGSALAWAQRLVDAVATDGFGWLPAGVFAAACVDLGLPPRSAAPLLQVLAAPGLLAHALEMSGKTILDLPFVDESRYEFVNDGPAG